MNLIKTLVNRWNSPLEVPFTIEQAKLEEIQHRASYIHRILVGFDIFLNVLLNGHEDETLSAHIGRSAKLGKKWAIFLARCLNVIQPNHVVISQAADTGRAKDLIKIEENSGNLGNLGK